MRWALGWWRLHSSGSGFGEWPPGPAPLRGTATVRRQSERGNALSDASTQPSPQHHHPATGRGPAARYGTPAWRPAGSFLPPGNQRERERVNERQHGESTVLKIMMGKDGAHSQPGSPCSLLSAGWCRLWGLYTRWRRWNTRRQSSSPRTARHPNRHLPRAARRSDWRYEHRMPWDRDREFVSLVLRVSFRAPQEADAPVMWHHVLLTADWTAVLPGNAVVVSLPHTADGGDVCLHQVVLSQIWGHRIKHVVIIQHISAVILWSRARCDADVL